MIARPCHDQAAIYFEDLPLPDAFPETLPIGMVLALRTASGFLASVNFSTPLSTTASTLSSSMVSGSWIERSKEPELRSQRY